MDVGEVEPVEQKNERGGGGGAGVDLWHFENAQKQAQT